MLRCLPELVASVGVRLGPGTGSGCSACPARSTPAQCRQALDLPLKPACLCRNMHSFRGLPRSRLGDFPVNSVSCAVHWSRAHGLLETTTGDSCFQNQVLSKGEGWSQRNTFELDPPRQRSCAADSRNPSQAGSALLRPGTQPAPSSF